MNLNDGHCHFLSERFFALLGREKFSGEAAPDAPRVATVIACTGDRTC